MGYHLARRRVISTPSDVQIVYRYPKETFILLSKYHALVLHMLLYVITVLGQGLYFTP